ncbi:MAG: family 2 glycosyl transferase [Parcubacteria group bacterium Gr01-1014_56]|nr:MAG: family 2 glycosyl transferase [Parcubacteria group bacterium Gr01-1014_56]
MKETPDISIVVLNWNTSDLLKGALESIVSTAGDINYEVVVIDNASTDGGFKHVSENIRHNPRFTFIQNEKNLGWAAINIMLERSRTKYIVTIDPDALLHAGALQALYAFMESHPQAGAVTASLLNPDGSPQLYYRRIMTPSIYFFTTIIGRVIDKYLLGLTRWRHYRYENLDVSHVSEVEQPAWPCLMWRREALGAYIVDERIPFYFLDVEMSRSLYNRGYKTYLVPQATITHLKSTSYNKKESSWRRKEYNRSLMVYFKKHYPFSAPLVWVAAWVDRALRALSRAFLGREPLR